MGLFGISEVLLNIGQGVKQEVFDTRIKGLMPTREDWRRSAGPIARGSVLGFLLGILPGIGAIIPTFISYALEKRIARQPERFGRGAIEGVAGPEAANNAATGGSMIPLLTLGLAPNVVMAVLLGAFLIHGVQPGPLLIKEHPEIFWGVITSMYVGNVMLLVLNLPLIGLWVQLLRVPYGILFPLILLFCVIGVSTCMEHDERGRLRDLSTSLMRLHRLLLDRERGLYEDRHGAIPTRELFSLVLNDEQFAWLRSLSTLIAQIDEVVDADEAVAPETVQSAFREAHRLLKSGDPSDFRDRYHAALQDSPDIVMAHAGVSKVLGGA